MSDELLIQEVTELTDLMRSSPRWKALREALSERGVDPATSLLAGFFEDESFHSLGAIVTEAGDLYEFERSTQQGAKGLLQWRRVQTTSELRENFRAIDIAVEMLKGDKPTRRN